MSRAQSQLTRSRIESIVSGNPGIHTAQVAVLMGVSWNTCQHHIRAMQSSGQVAVEKIDGKLRVFARKGGAVQDKVANAVLRDPTNRRVAGYILSHPGRNQATIAGALDLTTTSVHRRLVRMEEAGLIERLPVGRTTLIHASPDMSEAYVNAGLQTSKPTVTTTPITQPIHTTPQEIVYA